MNRLQKAGRFRPILLVASLLYLGATLVALHRYPAVWVDEGWIAEPAWSLAEGGPLGNPSHGSEQRFADRVYWMPPLEFLVLSAADRTGLDPLTGGRLVSMLAGLAALWILLGWGRQVLEGTGGDHTQPGPAPATPAWPWLLLLALAFTLDPTLWKVHRTIRFEAVTGLFALAAAALAWNPRRRFRGPAAGTAAALAALTHPNGLLALVAVTGLFFLRRTSIRDSVRATAGAAAAAIVLALPFALYLWGDRSAAFADVLGQNAPHLAGRAGPVVVQWIREWHRYAAYFAWPRLAGPLLAWIAVAAAGAALRAPRGLGWLLGVYVVGLAALPNKSPLYLTLAAPYLYLLAAWVGRRVAGAGRRGEGSSGRLRGFAAAGLAGIWILWLAGADAALLVRNRDCDYRAWTAPFERAVPAGAPVAGTFLTWFPLRDHPYLEFHRRRAGDLLEARPEYVIWGDAHSRDPLFERLRRELGPFLAAHADTVAASASPCYGNAVLYRPRWDEAPPGASGWAHWEGGAGGAR